MPVLAALTLFLLALGNYLLRRDLLYPGFLQAALWFVAVALLAVNQESFIRVSESVYVLLVAGVTSFSLGSFVGSWRHRPYLKRTFVRAGTLPSPRVTLALAAVVLLGLALYVTRARELSMTGPFTNPFMNLRFAVSENADETGGFGRVGYFGPLAYLLAAITILRRIAYDNSRRTGLLMAGALVIALTFGVLSSGRSVLLPLVLIVLTLPAVLRVVSPLRTATLLLVLVVTVFAGVGIALEKGGSTENTIAENWVTLRESFLAYSLGAVPAFDVFLRERPDDLTLGANSLRTVLAVGRQLGFNVEVVPLVQPFVNIPMPMNVYTVYQPYTKDFGRFGVLGILFLLGLGHALLYRGATTREPHSLFVFLFAVSMFPLAMQVFQDTYLSLLSTWIQYGTHAMLFFFIWAEKRRPFWRARSWT